MLHTSGPAAWAAAMAGDSDTPELVWTHRMRGQRLVPQASSTRRLCALCLCKPYLHDLSAAHVAQARCGNVSMSCTAESMLLFCIQWVDQSVRGHTRCVDVQMLRHLGDFPRRIAQHAHAVYEYTPAPPVGYPELADEVSQITSILARDRTGRAWLVPELRSVLRRRLNCRTD